MADSSRRHLVPVAWGIMAGLALLLFYLALLKFSSGSWAHVMTEIRRLWYWLGLLAAGFGIQVGLAVRLRRYVLHRRAANVVGLTGTGTSTSAMLACCAHHLADVLPLIGLSGIAVFLTRYQMPVLVFGLAVNAGGIAYLWRQLRQCRVR